MRKFVFIFILVLAGGAEAQTPFIFEAGTPAKASEVNSNFDYFDDQVDQLYSTIDAIKQCDPPSTANQISMSYTKKVGPLGKQFFIGQARLTLVKAGIVDIPTGDRYEITFPHVMASSFPLVSKWAEDYLDFCPMFEIAGYPARTLTLSFTRTMKFMGPNNMFRMDAVIEQTVEILIGQTVVSFYIFGAQEEIPRNAPIAVTDTYTDEFIYAGMVDHAGIIQGLDDVIDYIDIVKLP